ncbi:hypothetical protein Tco_0570009 [Tanacetum coccineum]
MRKPGMFRIAPPQGITRTPQLPHALGTLIFTCLKSSGVIHTTSLLANTGSNLSNVPSSSNSLADCTTHPIHFCSTIIGYGDLIQGVRKRFTKTGSRDSDLSQLSLQETNFINSNLFWLNLHQTQAWLWHEGFYLLKLRFITLLSKERDRYRTLCEGLRVATMALALSFHYHFGAEADLGNITKRVSVENGLSGIVPQDKRSDNDNSDPVAPKNKMLFLQKGVRISLQSFTLKDYYNPTKVSLREKHQ